MLKILGDFQLQLSECAFFPQKRSAQPRAGSHVLGEEWQHFMATVVFNSPWSHCMVKIQYYVFKLYIYILYIIYGWSWMCLINLIRTMGFLHSFTISIEYWRAMSSFETYPMSSIPASNQPMATRPACNVVNCKISRPIRSWLWPPMPPQIKLNDLSMRYCRNSTGGSGCFFFESLMQPKWYQQITWKWCMPAKPCIERLRNFKFGDIPKWSKFSWRHWAPWF